MTSRSSPRRDDRLVPLLILLALSIIAASTWPRPASAAEYFDLGLRLMPPDPARATEGMSMGERLAAIDSLTAVHSSPALSSDSTLVRIAALYAGSGLMKHKVYAQETLDGLRDEGDASALITKGYAYDRAFNPWDGRRVFDELVRRNPDLALAHRAQGVFLLNDGLFTLDEDELAESLRSFRRAVRCEDAAYEDWLGLASALMANARREELREVGDRLMTYGVDSPAPRLYLAVGLLHQELDYSAQETFEEAIAMMSPDMQWRFRDIEGYLGRSAGDELGESLLAELAPRSLLYWWDRMVENEVLFGDPVEQRHGWQSHTGEVHLKLGRPQRQAYYPPFSDMSFEEVLAFNDMDRHRTHITRAMFDHKKRHMGLWIWILRTRRVEIPYVFQQMTGRFTDWTPTPHSSITQGKFIDGGPPMGLGIQWGEEDVEYPVHIEARHVAYGSRSGRTLVESYASVYAPSPEAPKAERVRMTVLDDSGTVVEQRVEVVDESVDRQRLLDQVAHVGTESAGYLVQFGADLAPGHYIVRMEVEGADGTTLTATDQGYDVHARREPFELSDLLLCDSFETLAGQDVPDEFIKHAHVVLPHPEHEIPADQDRILVYYEVYGATLDDRGDTHLDVLYEIFDRDDFHATDAGNPFPDTDQGLAVERAFFPDQKTGRSYQGVVVKGTMVELEKLEKGSYVVVITVTDRMTRRESQRMLRFFRAGDRS